MADARGWAVVAGDGKVFVKTISDTRRAAIVNYLCVEHRVLLTSLHGDEDIEELWAHYGSLVFVREVVITINLGS